MKARILVIDDEAAIRDSLRMILEYEGYEFVGASSGPEGIALVEREAPDLVFLDIKMPGMDGLEVLSRLKIVSDDAARCRHLRARDEGHRRRGRQARRVRLHREATEQRATCSSRVRNALEQNRLRDENVELRKARRDPARDGGRARPAIRQVMEAVRRAAPTNATVLIQGESGVGKELVARAIHRNSLRSRERFVQVNCAAIPEELIESELFGHEKGSFTGATEKQIGKFEQADRGTIFLDEVGDMSLKTQAKVLRVLQEGEVERVGSSRTIKVDVRVIAATNKDLERGDREGHVPRGPVLPPERDPDLRAAAARAARGHPGARAALPRRVRAREQLPAAADHARGDGRAAAAPMEGATSGSCATRWSG